MKSRRGVSEVLDEVRLVAIVVILASVLGVQFMGMGSDANAVAPKASIDVADATDTYPDRAFVLHHRAGDDLEPETLRIVIRHVDQGTRNASLTYTGSGVSGDGLTAFHNDWVTAFTGPAAPSDRITIKATGSPDLSAGHT